MKEIPVALQLYSVRNDCKSDFPATLKKVKEMGYDGVELAGFNGLNISELNAITKDLNLKIFSAHVDRSELMNDPLRSAELYEALGCDFVAYPGPERTNWRAEHGTPTLSRRPRRSRVPLRSAALNSCTTTTITSSNSTKARRFWTTCSSTLANR